MASFLRPRFAPDIVTAPRVTVLWRPRAKVPPLDLTRISAATSGYSKQEVTPVLSQNAH